MYSSTERSVEIGGKDLGTPNLFASYRLGDVTMAGVRFFPWRITNTQAVLVNAYDLMENPKCQNYRKRLEREAITIREHIKFDGPLMIDSGAYYFIRNGNIHVNPLKVLGVENRSGADIGVVLDHPFPPSAEDKSQRINRTIKNTKKMLAAYKEEDTPPFELLPVIHGHDLPTIKSTVTRLQRIVEKYNGRELNKAGIGSLAPLAQNGSKGTAVQVLTTVRSLLPDAYLHCFSMGSSLLMLLAFYCGADTVDSQTWIMSAAFKFIQLPGHHIIRLATRERKAHPYQYRKRLREMKDIILRLYDEEGFVLKDWSTHTGKVLRDPNDGDLDQYISELTDRRGNQHIHNRACHNLWVFNFEVRRAQEEMKRGRFEQFVEFRLKDSKYYPAFLMAREIWRTAKHH